MAAPRWKAGATVQADYSYPDAYKAEIIKGMLDFWRGTAGTGGSEAVDAFLAGGAERPANTSQTKGYILGNEVAEMMRQVVRRGVVVEWDELGELVHGNVGFVDRTMNIGGEAIETVTAGMVKPGDVGGAEDSLAALAAIGLQAGAKLL